MYYVVYGFLWTLSLLPLRVLYFISDGLYGLVFYVFKYRRKIVMDNIRQAFPGMDEKEITRTAKKFYHNFIDAFIEAVKLLSSGKKFIARRSTGEFDLINNLVARGKNVHIMAGHQFNWEFGNLLYSINLITPFVGIYMPVTNKALDRVFYNLRGRYGTILISAQDFKTRMHKVFSKQYLLGLAADQNPGDPGNAYWMNFLNRPAPFVTGPMKGAVKNNTAIVMAAFEKRKRGRYHFSIKLLADEGSKFTPEQLTVMYRDELERIIKKDPSNYLWSHRRWKHEWKPEYGDIIK